MENLKEVLIEKIELYLDDCYASLEEKTVKCYDLEEIWQKGYLNSDLADKIIRLREETLMLQGSIDAYEKILRDINQKN